MIKQLLKHIWGKIEKKFSNLFNLPPTPRSWKYGRNIIYTFEIYKFSINGKILIFKYWSFWVIFFSCPLTLMWHIKNKALQKQWTSFVPKSFEQNYFLSKVLFSWTLFIHRLRLNCPVQSVKGKTKYGSGRKIVFEENQWHSLNNKCNVMLFLVLLYFGMSWTWSLYSELFIFHSNVNVSLRFSEWYLHSSVDTNGNRCIYFECRAWKIGQLISAVFFFFLTNSFSLKTFMCFGIIQLSTVPFSVLRNSSLN